jgi:hypothetical protein
MTARRVLLGCSGAALQTVERLRRWVVSLPWVVELPPARTTDPLRFAVDCSPLDCHAVWLLFDPAGDRRIPPAIIVTLPTAVAQRGVAAGWAVDITDLGDDRRAVAVATPGHGRPVPRPAGTRRPFVHVDVRTRALDGTVLMRTRAPERSPQ